MPGITDITPQELASLHHRADQCRDMAGTWAERCRDEGHDTPAGRDAIEQAAYWYLRASEFDIRYADTTPHPRVRRRALRRARAAIEDAAEGLRILGQDARAGDLEREAVRLEELASVLPDILAP